MSISLQKLKQSHWFYIALLFIIAVLAYWQISFLKYSVTHDMINCWIPWRYYISNCFENHTFPFWNPYQQLGYPIHADLQGPSWYPESILLSMTIGQDNVTVQLLFIFYVFMAGMGMYFLSLAFQKNRTIAFVIGISYMLGGFFVSHVQHFYAIIGAAWLPFIILNYYKMLQEKSFVRALYAAVFMFLNLTGGNHTFSIILFYFFLTLLAYFIYQSVKEKRKEEIKKYILLNFVFGISTLLMISVVIVAYMQTAPYVSRLSGMLYEKATVCPLSPQSLLSLFIPFSTVNGQEFFNTDPSMSNMYFGIGMIPFFILFLFYKKDRLDYFLLSFASICLLASFGEYMPVHKFIFDYVPLMNLFRFPSYFSLFTVLILLILAGKKLEEFTVEPDKFKKALLYSFTSMGVIITIFLIYSIFKNQGKSFFFLNDYSNLFEFLSASSLYQNIILQGSIQLIFILLTLYSIKRYNQKWLSIFSILTLINLFISVQLNIGYVGFSPASPKELKDYIATLPKDYPIPTKNKIIENTEEIGQKHGLYRNTSIFHKRIGADVFNSYAFSHYALLKDSFPHLYNSMRNNELIYFSKNVLAESKLRTTDTSNINHKTIVLSNDDHTKASSFVLNTTADSINNNSYEIKHFSPNEITVSTLTETNEVLTILQSHYTGWHAYIDNKETEILLSNLLTMSILLPEGKHEVKFQYHNRPVIIGAIISALALFLVLGLISFYWIKRKIVFPAISLWGGLIFIFIYYFI
ncbi:MAG: YfhO family protein [Bacteroidia bacterium]|nr:YfhO family protein [Bacteroidia bacterium]